MSDVDDVTAAADNIEHRLPHIRPSTKAEQDEIRAKLATHADSTHNDGRESATKLMFGSVADRLDHATTQALLKLARGGIGEPEN